MRISVSSLGHVEHQHVQMIHVKFTFALDANQARAAVKEEKYLVDGEADWHRKDGLEDGAHVDGEIVGARDERQEG